MIGFIRQLGCGLRKRVWLIVPLLLVACLAVVALRARDHARYQFLRDARFVGSFEAPPRAGGLTLHETDIEVFVFSNPQPGLLERMKSELGYRWNFEGQRRVSHVATGFAGKMQRLVNQQPTKLGGVGFEVYGNGRPVYVNGMPMVEPADGPVTIWFYRIRQEEPALVRFVKGLF